MSDRIYSLISACKSRRTRLTTHVACMEEKRNAYSVMVGKSEGKIYLGRHRRRREDNIRMDLREMEWGGTD
jgi:hypothetical protein